MPDMKIGVALNVTGASQVRGMLADFKQMQQIAKNLRVNAGGTDGGGGSSGGSSRGGGSSSGGSGPMARAIAARQQLHEALLNGSTSQIFDAQVRHIRAQAALQKAQQAIMGPDLDKTIKMAAPKAAKPAPDFWQRLMGVVSSSRVGFGGSGIQAMPLVGQLSKLFGASGPAGGIIMAGVAGLAMFVDRLHEAAVALTEIRSAAQISGGNARNMGFFGALGIGAGAVPGLAGGLRGTLAGGDAFAMGQAGRLGLPGIAVPTALAGTNQAGVLEQAIKTIATKYTTAELRLAAARNLSLESIIPQIELYARHKNVIDADTRALEKAANSNATQNAADFMFQLGRAQTMLGTFSQGVAGPILGDWAKGLGNAADALRGGSRIAGLFTYGIRQLVGALFPLVGITDTLLTGIGKIGPAFKALYGFIETFINGVIDKLPDPIKGQMGGFRLPDWKDLADPINDLTGALNANTDAQNAATGAYKNGTYGGGSRARGALPGGLKGSAFSAAVAGNALRLGAWSL